MTHPITPSPELVQQWVAEIWHEGAPVRVALSDEHIATRAAQWGWDQREPEIQADVDAELEACIDWMSNAKNHGLGWDLARALSNKLRAARRPKPPSLKELALQGLTRIESTNDFFSNQMKDLATIRRALEALSDDQH